MGDSADCGHAVERRQGSLKDDGRNRRIVVYSLGSVKGNVSEEEYLDITLLIKEEYVRFTPTLTLTLIPFLTKLPCVSCS